MENMTYKQILDYALSVLYDLKVNQKKTSFYSLKEIIKYINYDASFDEIKDIAKYLDTYGYIKSLYIYGDVLAEITTRGIMYLEEKDERYIKSFQDFIKSKKKKEALKTAVDVIIDTGKKLLLKEIDEFREFVSNKNTKNQYDDYLIDIDILKIELSKNEPDNEILTQKTNKLLENIKFREQILKIVSKLNID